MTDKEIINLLSKLKFVSKIKPGDKIDVGSSYIYRNSMRTKFIRTFVHRDETRQKTLKYIKEIIDEGITTLSSNSIFKDLVNEGLKMLRPGLMNLMITYKDDHMMVSELESLVEVLDSRL